MKQPDAGEEKQIRSFSVTVLPGLAISLSNATNLRHSNTHFGLSALTGKCGC